MKHLIIAVLMCLFGFQALAQSSSGSSGNSPRESPAAAAQEEESSVAEDIGRMIGVMLKRTAEVLKDVVKGIAEGFRSASQEDSPENACTQEQERKGQCKPGSSGKQSESSEKQGEADSGFLATLFKALFGK